MESGYTKEQLEEKLQALKDFPSEYLNFIGKTDVYLGIKRIERKLKNKQYKNE